MSLSSSLDEWLKQPPMSASAADDFAGSLAGDMPDLGLNLTPEDIEWVDLEFLDLASGPPANHHGSAATRHHNHHSRGAHNPTLAGNFPDIFFDMTAPSVGGVNSGILGSLGNSSFPGPSGASSLMDEPPTATTLDLETEEKNFLAELFPPSAQIEQEEDMAPAVQVHPSSETSSLTPEPTQLPAPTPETKEDAAAADVDGVYSVPSDVLLTIKRQAEPDALGRTITTKRKKTSVAEQQNSVAKISVKTDRAKNVTRVTILPSKGQRGQSHSFQINTANLPQVGRLLRPLQLERLSVFNKGVPPPAPAYSSAAASAAKGRPGAAQTEIAVYMKEADNKVEVLPPADLQVREVRLDKDQDSLRVLKDHGIKLDGFTCATTNSGQKFWVCPEEGCKKAYPRPSKLKVHLMGHSNIRPFKCAVENCGWAFTTAFKLKRHMNSHEKLKTAVCVKPGCGKEFSDVYNLKKHMLLHERELVYTCKDCGAECDTQPEYVKHLKVHKEKLLQEAAAAAASLAAGANKGEDGAEDGGKLKCQHVGCEKAFKTQSALKMHFRLHTGSRPFVCSYEGCSWAFPSSSKLRRHERGHKNVRSYVCEVCQKSYLRSEHLKNHQLSHDPLAHPFVCAFERCGQKFSAKSSLYVHLKRHPQQAGLLQGRLRCLLDACGGAFLYKKDLQAHMQLFHSAPAQPRHVSASARSNSSDDGAVDELDFIALLSAVDSDLPNAMNNAAGATPAIVTASNGIVLDHLITIETTGVIGGGGGDRLVTVDTSAITPTKNQNKAAAAAAASFSVSGQQQQRRSRCGRAIIPAIKI